MQRGRDRRTKAVEMDGVCPTDAISLVNL